ncbi:hypothetical protein HDU97_003152 [Phlyctochytrium planicorne]|nr:hypothetical protein HDU97_003152 [Phlyctochytrium planicorne]
MSLKQQEKKNLLLLLLASIASPVINAQDSLLPSSSANASLSPAPAQLLTVLSTSQSFNVSPSIAANIPSPAISSSLGISSADLSSKSSINPLAGTTTSTSAAAAVASPIPNPPFPTTTDTAFSTEVAAINATVSPIILNDTYTVMPNATRVMGVGWGLFISIFVGILMSILCLAVSRSDGAGAIYLVATVIMAIVVMSIRYTPTVPVGTKVYPVQEVDRTVGPRIVFIFFTSLLSLASAGCIMAFYVTQPVYAIRPEPFR